MKITVIGCGNAFSNINYNQCFLLEEGDQRMLVDCGYQTGAALHKAGDDCGERCWPFPLWEEYDELLRSDVADLKNVGGRPAGTIIDAFTNLGLYDLNDGSN